MQLSKSKSATRILASTVLSVLIFAGSPLFVSCTSSGRENSKPNILIIMSDNQSWNHAGAYGDSVVQTPHIDQAAKNGVLFTRAFCSAPSCTPARAAMLMGQEIYRLKEGANLWGTLPAEFTPYPDLMEKAGYQVGYEGKGWGPGNFEAAGRSRNPGGDLYKSFSEFLTSATQNGKKPWLYWFSSKEPHRPYSVGSGTRAGIDSNRIKVPSYLPGVPEVKGDIADYYAAIQHFDKETGALLKELAKTGQLENTIVIICSDNGWQMPRGLGNLYDSGTRIPLIISWPGVIKPGRRVDDIVSLNDIAPTLLELAGIAIPKAYTAKSLVPQLRAAGNGIVDNTRTFTVMARERHAFVRQNGLGYPGRAIRTEDFLLIRNPEPGRWPAGDPPLYGDVDAHMMHYPAPAKLYMLKHRNNTSVAPLFKLAFDKRPMEELYDLRNDPDQLVNLAMNEKYKSIKDSLSAKLTTYLTETKDPRALGLPIIWDTAKYYQPRDFHPRPSEEAKRVLGLKEVYDYLGER